MWWRFIPPLLKSNLSPFVCTVITASGSFPLREKDEEEEEEEEGWVSSPPPLRWDLLVIPRLLQGRYGCGGIPWRHAPLAVAVETRLTTKWARLPPRAPRGPYIRAGRLCAAATQSAARPEEMRVGADHWHTHRRTIIDYFFFVLFIGYLSCLLNMAVTEAGCDLTYCKMRGIVAVLTGERK